jgi:hypothetical protein
MQPNEIHNEGESGVTNSTPDCSENFAEVAENDSYKLQLLQSLRDHDRTTHGDFCTEIQERCEEDGFSEHLIFCNKSTFHISGKVNKQNVRIWGAENPRGTVDHVQDSPKVNVFCAMSCKKVYGPFFFQEKTVTGASYLDMLIN